MQPRCFSSRLASLICQFAVATWLASNALAAGPRLVVVVSVDQLCQDYLIRFQDNFPADGFFLRAQRQGASYPECHHRHAFTVTAPGHAVQLTGASPHTNGVIGNSWFDRETGKSVYCVRDATVKIVGGASDQGVSPRNLLVDTVGDRLKMATDGKGRMFGVSIKDRAAILMAGHRADGAYWFDGGRWVTSDYYRPDLPGYLRNLNDSDQISRYGGKTWELLLPLEKYHNRRDDDFRFELPPPGFGRVFPHLLAAAGDIRLPDQVGVTPFGNELTLNAAKEIIAQEKLGKDEFPDLLAINLSSNDYIGHAYGPHSLEVEDVTYRTDRQLAAFCQSLDELVGAGEWTIAVTADHGVAPIVEYAQEQKLPAKRIPLDKDGAMKKDLEARLRRRLGLADDAPPLVQKIDDGQVYLEREKHPALQGQNFRLAQEAVRDWLLEQPYIAAARTRCDLLAGGGEDRIARMLQRSFHPRLSGDVLFVLPPFCVPGSGKLGGTTHGSPWRYDTHVPLLLLGARIRPGVYDRDVSPAALASTVAMLLGVDAPAGNVELPLHEALSPATQAP